MNTQSITVHILVNIPLSNVWEYYTKPEHITAWSFASNDWEAPRAENDLSIGGTFMTRMQAKDGSAGFDFTGTYTALKEDELIEYTMNDGRHVKTEFKETPEGVLITVVFDPEHENSAEMQKGGWKAILDNFKKYAESHK